MSIKELDVRPLIGGLNQLIFVDNDGQVALQRVPLENRDLLQTIRYGYQAIGFTAAGGRMRRRTPFEQFTFTQKAAQKRLRVLPPLAIQGDHVMYPFLSQAVTLDVSLTSPGSNRGLIMNQLIDDLYQAHRSGFIYGDRWSGNILVDPKYGVLHIDFDIEISGPYARELDIAQIVYHTARIGKEAVLLPLALSLINHLPWFDAQQVIRFVRNLSRYLSLTHVGGAETESEMFTALLQSLVKK